VSIGFHEVKGVFALGFRKTACDGLFCVKATIPMIERRTFPVINVLATVMGDSPASVPDSKLGRLTCIVHFLYAIISDNNQCHFSINTILAENCMVACAWTGFMQRDDGVF
jgi:hypothetical protein